MSECVVYVAHRDPIVSMGLAAVLGREPEFHVINHMNSIDHLEAVVQSYAPTLVVTDYEQGMALAGGTQRVLVVTGRDREIEVRNALQRGIRGYLLLGSGSDELLEAVRSVGRGSHFLCRAVAPSIASSLGHTALTSRESDVLHLLAEGLANKQIASRLDIAVETVKCHVKAILEKLDASTRTQAAAVATRRGLVREDARPSRALRPIPGSAPRTAFA